MMQEIESKTRPKLRVVEKNNNTGTVLMGNNHQASIGLYSTNLATKAAQLAQAG